jgi:hypothetical protein
MVHLELIAERRRVKVSPTVISLTSYSIRYRRALDGGKPGLQ